MKRNAGYTFIEILIAMTVLIVGIVAIMRMLPIALRETQLAGEQTVASHHADAHLGRMRAAGVEAAYEDAFFNPNRYTTTLQGLSTAAQLYTGYRTEFGRMSAEGDVDLQRVLFTLEMPDGRRETFVTYMTKQ